MSDRVNQIREALAFPPKLTGDVTTVSVPNYKTIQAAARDFADLLTRLEDGSAYRDAAKVLQRDEYREWTGRKTLSEIVAENVVNAALGLQEDTDD